jgi:hypothetical protein
MANLWGEGVEMGIAFNLLERKGRLWLRYPSLKPYWGKPTVRNFRGGIGNRSTV